MPLWPPKGADIHTLMTHEDTRQDIVLTLRSVLALLVKRNIADIDITEFKVAVERSPAKYRSTVTITFDL